MWRPVVVGCGDAVVVDVAVAVRGGGVNNNNYDGENTDDEKNTTSSQRTREPGGVRHTIRQEESRRQKTFRLKSFAGVSTWPQHVALESA